MNTKKLLLGVFLLLSFFVVLVIIFMVTVPREGHRGGDTVASVYHASFTKVLFSNLYSIAVSTILIFILGASSSLLGVASALSPLPYFAGPILSPPGTPGAGTGHGIYPALRGAFAHSPL